MNVKPLILAAALGLALNAHAAPKAASKGKPVKTQKAVKQAAAATPADSGAVRLSDASPPLPTMKSLPSASWHMPLPKHANTFLKARKSAKTNSASKSWRNWSTNP